MIKFILEDNMLKLNSIRYVFFMILYSSYVHPYLIFLYPTFQFHFDITFVIAGLPVIMLIELPAPATKQKIKEIIIVFQIMVSYYIRDK